MKYAKILPRLFAGLALSIALTVPAVAFSLSTFTTETEAQQHCPNDVVVWLNLPTMIWHYKSQRWYARTIHGAFACEKEAGAAGARGTRNGQ